MNEILKYIIFFLLGIIVYYFLFTNPSVGSRKVIEGFNYTLEIIPEIYVKSGYTFTSADSDGNTTVTLTGSPIIDLSNPISELIPSNLTTDISKSYFPTDSATLSGTGSGIEEALTSNFNNYKIKRSETSPGLKMIYIIPTSSAGAPIDIIDSSNGNFISNVRTTFTGVNVTSMPLVAGESDISSIVNEVNTIIQEDNNSEARSPNNLQDTSEKLSKLIPIGKSSFDTITATVDTPAELSLLENKQDFDNQIDLLVFGASGNNVIIIELRKDDTSDDFLQSRPRNIYILLKNQTLTKTPSVFNFGSDSVKVIRNTSINVIINVFNDTTNNVRIGDNNSFIVIGLDTLVFDNATAPLTSNILTSYGVDDDNGEIGGDGIDYFTSYYLRDLIPSDSSSPSDIVGDTFSHADAATLMLMSSFATTNADGSQTKLQGCESAPEGYGARCQRYSPEGRYFRRSETKLANTRHADTCNNQEFGSLQRGNTAYGSQPCNPTEGYEHGYSDICCEDRQCSSILLRYPDLCSGRMQLYNAICPPQADDNDSNCEMTCCGIEIHSYIERLFNDIINFNTANNVTPLPNRKINRSHIRNYIYGNLLDLSTYINNGSFTAHVEPAGDISNVSPLKAFEPIGTLEDPLVITETSNIIRDGDNFFNALDEFIHLGVTDSSKDAEIDANDHIQIVTESRIITLDFAVCPGLEDSGNCGTSASTPIQENCEIIGGVCKSPLDTLKTIVSPAGDPLDHINLKSSVISTEDTSLEQKFTNLQVGNNLDTILNQGQTHNYTHIINSYKNFINRYVQGNEMDIEQPTDATTLEQDIKESIFALTLQFRFQTGNPVSPLDASFPITPGFTDMTYTQFAEAI